MIVQYFAPGVVPHSTHLNDDRDDDVYDDVYDANVYALRLQKWKKIIANQSSKITLNLIVDFRF